MKFRQWFLEEKECEDKLSDLLDNNNLSFFFKKDKDYFGVGEDGRIVFAKMKNPDDDLPSGWEKEVSFTAVNITKLTKGEPSQQVFNIKSIKDIHVVDKDEIISNLKKIDQKNNKSDFKFMKIDFNNKKSGNLFAQNEE